MYFNTFYPITGSPITISPPKIPVGFGNVGIAIDETTWTKNHFQYIPSTGEFKVRTNVQDTTDLGIYTISVEYGLPTYTSEYFFSVWIKNNLVECTPASFIETPLTIQSIDNPIMKWSEDENWMNSLILFGTNNVQNLRAECGPVKWSVTRLNKPDLDIYSEDLSFENIISHNQDEN